jgi:RNA polymerase sigma-70 factor (ECF subfamily)
LVTILQFLRFLSKFMQSVRLFLLPFSVLMDVNAMTIARATLPDVNTELIHGAQDGDQAMVAALYEHFNRGIFRYLYYRVGDRQTAEDLTSEVFVRMLRFISGFRPPSSTFQAWLFQIARNVANDHFRKTGSHPLSELSEALPADSAGLDEAVNHRLTTERLRQAVLLLSESQRDVILLRFISAMPISDVAQALNKSEDAVKGLQRRALMTLRNILTEWEVHYE